MSRSIFDQLFGNQGISGVSVLSAALSGDGKMEFSSTVQLHADLPTAPAPEVSEEEWQRLYDQLLERVDDVVAGLRTENLEEEFGRQADRFESIARHLREDHGAGDFTECGSIDKMLVGIEIIGQRFGISEIGKEKLPNGQLASLAEAIEEIAAAGETDVTSDSFYGIPISGLPSDVKALKSRLESVVKEEIRKAQIEAGTREGYELGEFDGCEALVKKDETGDVVAHVFLAGAVPSFVSEFEKMFRSSLSGLNGAGVEEDANAEVATV